MKKLFPSRKQETGKARNLYYFFFAFLSFRAFVMNWSLWFRLVRVMLFELEIRANGRRRPCQKMTSHVGGIGRQEGFLLSPQSSALITYLLI
jgi:hypothetical protein